MQIPVLDHVYYIVDRDSYPSDCYLPHSGNGLVLTSLGGVVIATGTDTGPLEVEVQRLREEPALDAEEWEEVVDVTVHAMESLLLCGHGFAPYDLPPLTDAPGTYRLRVQARGRDTAGAAGRCSTSRSRPTGCCSGPHRPRRAPCGRRTTTSVLR